MQYNSLVNGKLLELGLCDSVTVLQHCYHEYLKHASSWSGVPIATKRKIPNHQLERSKNR